MIFYNFNMIKDDSHFEMKPYRLIIDRRFYACGVPAVRRLMRNQAPYSRLKISCKDMTIFSKWSDSDHCHFDMIYDCRFEIRENFSSRELFRLLNRFWSRDRRDGRCNFRPCGLFIFVSKQKSNFS